MYNPTFRGKTYSTFKNHWSISIHFKDLRVKKPVELLTSQIYFTSDVQLESKVATNQVSELKQQISSLRNKTLQPFCCKSKGYSFLVEGFNSETHI